MVGAGNGTVQVRAGIREDFEQLTSSADAVMAELQARVRERLRAAAARPRRLAARFEDPALFAEVERLLHTATQTGDADALILPELLGDPDTWRLDTAMRYQSHRAGAAGGAIDLRQAPPADAGPALAVRVQPRQLRAAAAREPGAVRLRAGARGRNRAPPAGAAPALARPCEARLRRPALRRRHRRRLRGALPRAGAERLCAPRHDITVLTTCARDYVTWANAYPPGETRDARVRVIRFPVARRRRVQAFADLSDEVFDGGASRERQEEWFRENGPTCPALLDHLCDARRRLRPGAVLDLPLCAVVLRPAAGRRPRRARADGRRGSGRSRSTCSRSSSSCPPATCS